MKMKIVFGLIVLSLGLINTAAWGNGNGNGRYVNRLFFSIGTCDTKEDCLESDIIDTYVILDGGEQTPIYNGEFEATDDGRLINLRTGQEHWLQSVVLKTSTEECPEPVLLEKDGNKKITLELDKIKTCLRNSYKKINGHKKNGSIPITRIFESDLLHSAWIWHHTENCINSSTLIQIPGGIVAGFALGHDQNGHKENFKEKKMTVAAALILLGALFNNSSRECQIVAVTTGIIGGYLSGQSGK